MFKRAARLRGMQKFTLIWFGQLISLFGTATTRFALMIWAYEQTGQATTLALLGFSSFALGILFSPAAGVIIDRWDRRWIMMAADGGAGLMTLALLLLYTSGHLQIWHLYLAGALTGAFEAFQLPAYSAATTMLVPSQYFARASGMRSLASSASEVFGPFCAGIFLKIIGISGVMVVDIATVVVAIFTLLLVSIPHPQATTDGAARDSDFWRNMRFGFSYIRERSGLLGLLVIFLGISFASGLTYFGVLPALILARTHNDELALASVQSALGIGGIIGGLLVSTWGGPKRRIHAVLLFTGLSFLFGDFILAVGRIVPVWVLGAFVGAFFVPFIVGGNRAIWQMKVPPDVQGRVFAIQGMFQETTLALGYLLAGPLADRVLGPAMMPGGGLAAAFGWLVGVGPGAGIGLMFIGTCILGTTVSFCGYLIPAVRNVEIDLPNFIPESLAISEQVCLNQVD
jgi:MFS family permease